MITSKISKKALKENTFTSKEVFDLFDSLAVPCTKDLYGLWKGSDIKTGHPLEGYLPAAGWYGKYFKSNEDVFPLVMKNGKKKLYALNPRYIPLRLPFQRIPLQVIKQVGKLAPYILKTNKSSARLREIQYRQKIGPAMIYDHQAIIDVFRKYDENTLVGVMDIKILDTDKVYFFLLERYKKQPTSH